MADTTLKIAELREALAGVPGLKKSLKKPELVALYRKHIGSPPKKPAGKKKATKVVLEMELAPAPKKASSGKSTKAASKAKATKAKPAPKSPSAAECQDMTVVQLKAYLKKAGVAHKSTAKKPELIELCLGHRAPAKPAKPAKPASASKSGSGAKAGKKPAAGKKKPVGTKRKVIVASSSGSKSGSLSPLRSADDYMAFSIAALKDQLAKRNIKTAAKTKTGLVRALVKSGGGPTTAAGKRLAAMAAAATSPEAEKAVAAAEKAVEAAEKAEAAAGAAVAAAASAIEKPATSRKKPGAGRKKPSPKKPSPKKHTPPKKPLPAAPKKPSGGRKVAIETRWRDCGDNKMYDLDGGDCGNIRGEKYLLVNGARIGGSGEAMEKLKRSLEAEGIAHSWEMNPKYRALYEDQKCPEGEAYDLDVHGCAPFGTSSHQLAFKDVVITGSKATLDAYKKRLSQENIPSKISVIPKGKIAGKVKPAGGKVKPAAAKPASREPSPRTSPARGSGSGGRIATNPLHKDPGVLTDHLKTLSECLASLG